MKTFKKMLRLCGLLLFLLLAVCGLSLTGTAPVPPKGRNIISTETVIKKEDEEDENRPTTKAFTADNKAGLKIRLYYFSPMARNYLLL
jgi:hypothetical protein